MTYLCPKCKGIMQGISTTSIPPITTYVCMVCGYSSKPVKDYEDCQTLPPWLMEEESSNQSSDMR